MLDQLKELQLKALQELAKVDNTKELESWRVCYLGKKSELIKVLRSLATLSLAERKAVGACANEVKTNLESSLQQKGQVLREMQFTTSFAW